MTNDFPREQDSMQDNQEQEIHLRDYIRVLRKRKTTVLTFLILTFLIVVIVTFSSTPYYTASSQVLIEKNYTPSSLETGSPYVPYDPEFLTTQFELIRSSNVARRVVKQLKLDTRYKHYFFEDDRESTFLSLAKLKSGINSFLSGLFSSDKTANRQDLRGTRKP